MWFTTFTGTDLAGANMTGASVGAPLYSASNPPTFSSSTVCPSGLTLPQVEFYDIVSMGQVGCGFGMGVPSTSG